MIYVNTLSVTDKAGGIKTYLTHLLKALLGKDVNRKYVLICARFNQHIFDAFSSYSNAEIMCIDIQKPGPFRRIAYEQYRLPMILKKLQPGLLLIPSSIASLRAKNPQVLIHQYPQAIPSIRKSMPTDFLTISTLHVLYYSWFLGRSTKRAKWIVTVSKYLHDQFIRDFPKSKSKTSTILEGVSLDQFKPSKKRSKKYILFVSTLFPYKNAALLVRAYGMLGEDLQSKYKLRIVGKDPDGGQISKLRALSKELELGDHVEITGLIPFDSIRREYADAVIFVYPSSVETFGLPILEAMAMEVPVIASDAMSLPEVAGDAALIFKDGDVADLKSKMQELLEDKGLYQDMIEKGKHRARSFSWDSSAQEFIKLFDRLSSKG